MARIPILWVSSCKSPMPSLSENLRQMRTKKNHFSQSSDQLPQHVNTAEEVIEEVFRISHVGCGSHAMITMEVGKPSSQSQVTFQIDTGAECNFLSLKDYQQVTWDVH
ncbi:hypothetical protein P5673_016505 [Acropora cervicornis]|uniref:Uncharacterized protein n=1 Tax=Acropora cervicornis TaxID=6130 RepID=A0AAD9QG81_ACRCE|nr:hypothetical protein P5673_016505 [Acropora cervicornis]